MSTMIADITRPTKNTASTGDACYGFRPEAGQRPAGRSRYTGTARYANRIAYAGIGLTSLDALTA